MCSEHAVILETSLAVSLVKIVPVNLVYFVFVQSVLSHDIIF